MFIFDIKKIINFLKAQSLYWYFGLFMFIHYVIVQYFWVIDPTIEFMDKILGLFVGAGMLLILSLNLFKPSYRKTKVYFILLGVLCLWFGYFTPIDIANFKYPLITHIYYVLIDVFSVVYVMSNFDGDFFFRLIQKFPSLQNLFTTQAIYYKNK